MLIWWFMQLFMHTNPLFSISTPRLSRIIRCPVDILCYVAIAQLSRSIDIKKKRKEKKKSMLLAQQPLAIVKFEEKIQKVSSLPLRRRSCPAPRDPYKPIIVLPEWCVWFPSQLCPPLNPGWAPRWPQSGKPLFRHRGVNKLNSPAARRQSVNKNNNCER